MKKQILNVVVLYLLYDYILCMYCANWLVLQKSNMPPMSRSSSFSGTSMVEIVMLFPYLQPWEPVVELVGLQGLEQRELQQLNSMRPWVDRIRSRSGYRWRPSSWKRSRRGGGLMPQWRYLIRFRRAVWTCSEGEPSDSGGVGLEGLDGIGKGDGDLLLVEDGSLVVAGKDFHSNMFNFVLSTRIRRAWCQASGGGQLVSWSL